jgi:zinc transporter ZupT
MSLVLPLLAVLIGFAIAYFIRYSGNTINMLLAFSGAFLLSITVLEFIPHVYQQSDSHQIGIFILGGILFQLILEFLSGGAEHGHLHAEKNSSIFPWSLFISLCVHSLLEGFPIGENVNLMYAVMVHKIPVSIIISTFLFQTNLSKLQVMLFVLLFAIMTPLGTYLGTNTTFFNDVRIYIDAIVIGIFLHISTTILFESSKNHRFNAAKFSVIIVGFLVAYFLGHSH